MKEVLCDDQLLFDDGGTFPLVDCVINSDDYFDKLLYTSDREKQLVNKFYKGVVDSSFLANITSPCWFLNSTVFEQKYEWLTSCILSHEHVEKINKLGLNIFLSEPLNFVKGDFYTNKLLTYLETFAENNQLTKMNIFTCEHNVDLLNQKYSRLNFSCKDIFLTMISLEIKKNDLDFGKLEQEIQKKFICPNLTYNEHRHYVLLYLVTRSGNFSWKFKHDIRATDRRSPSYVNSFNHGHQNFLSLLHESPSMHRTIMKNNKKVKKQAPFVLDNKSSSKESSIVKYYNECFCAVVTETYFNSIYANISEKTLYAMAYGKPFVLVAAPHSLRYLKLLGFKTFDTIWDESYDKEEDPQLRMIKIFRLIDYIDSMSITELKRLFKEVVPILEHNAMVLKTFPINDVVLL